MHPSTLGEKVTAALSTAIAIAILGAAVTAQQARAPQGDQLATLESDLRYQLDLAFRHDRTEHRARLAEVDRTLVAWQNSPRTAHDDQLLATWFTDAIAKSMPGRNGEFPATPQFGRKVTRPLAAPTQPPRSASQRQAAVAPRLVDSTPNVSGPVAASPPDVPPANPNQRVAALVEPATARTLPGSATAQRGATSDSTPSLPLAAAATPVTPAFDEPESTPPASEHSIAHRAVPRRSAPVAERGTLPPLPVTNDVLPYNTEEAPAAPTAPASPVVQINLRELNARIAGYHQELGEIEAATVVDGPLAAARLERLVARLEGLAAQYQLVRLYHATLTDGERRQVARPRALDEVVELIGRHVKAADDASDIFAEFDAGETADDTEAPASDKSTLAERLDAIGRSVGLRGD